MKINVVFEGEMPNLTFVEVENLDGKSINVGKWLNSEERNDGAKYSYLQLDVNV